MWGLGEAEFKHENHIDDSYESDWFSLWSEKLGHYSHNAFWLPWKTLQKSGFSTLNLYWVKPHELDAKYKRIIYEEQLI